MSFVYAAKIMTNTINVIDVKTNYIIANIQSNLLPLDIKVIPNGQYVYVLTASSVLTIDHKTHQVVSNTRIINVGFDRFIQVQFAITSDAQFIYVINNVSTVVSVIDTKTSAIIANIDVGSSPRSLTITPDDKYVYVVISQAPNVGDTVFVIDIKKNVVIATVVVGHTPTNILADPSGCYVYVIGTTSDPLPNTLPLLSVIDTKVHQVVSTIQLSTTTNNLLAITSNGQYIYVANGDGVITCIDAKKHDVSASIMINVMSPGIAFSAIAVTPNNKQVYVASRSNNSVIVMDTKTNTVTRSIDIGETPSSMAITPDGRYVYVGTESSISPFDSSIYVIDLKTNAIKSTIFIDRSMVNALAVVPF
ncbi:beta-propeller fold lactonase family protein [Hazenella sp. IB182353]|uniref:beta-propeller fold lactonase family protein n=1 Tax=Polycladospora coralii TaxID=2771432 RepID=UPI0017465A23|nr:beta-propeller fold lactonase family protein [Polycladospora coralii]MBS7530174.1 beta-propeller fold lactonase family protein [Polycladospora coralii]